MKREQSINQRVFSRRVSRSKSVLLLLALALWAGCDGSGDTAGSLSGTVREADSQAPLADVRVLLGGAQATTGADGRFELRDVPVGPSMILRATATGFDTYVHEIVIQEGENTHDIALTRRTYYTADDSTSINVGVYLTPGVSTYRAVVFLVSPGEEDWRGFASGQPVTVQHPSPPQYPALVNAFTSGMRERTLQLAEEHGLALMGAERPDWSEPYDDVFAALERIAGQSGRPELAEAPLLLVGYSAGGYFAYHFARRHPERVIGFMSMKGGGHQGGTSPAVRAVPGYFFIGELDTPDRRANITQQFEVNRAVGALWAVAVEPGAGHEPPGDLDLFEHWMDAVLAARLPAAPPPGQPVTLNALEEASGWLGNRETFEIAAYGAYGGDPLEASWLPTMQTAQDWQAFVGGD